MRQPILIPLRVQKHITQPLFDITQVPERVRSSLLKGNYVLRFIPENPYATPGNKVAPLWVVDLPDGKQVGTVRHFWRKMRELGEVTYGKRIGKHRAAQ